MIKSIRDFFQKTVMSSVASQKLDGDIRAGDDMSPVEYRRLKGIIALTAFSLGFLMLFASQPVYSQSKKSLQKTVSGNVSKSLSGVTYIDPFAKSVIETVDRIKKSDRLVKLMATPRSKKSTSDLIAQKKLLVKVFNIPIKKKLPLLASQDQKNVQSAKAAIVPVIKKSSSPFDTDNEKGCGQ